MSVTIEELVRSLTLEEKAGLCSGRDFWRTKAVERLGILMADPRTAALVQKMLSDHPQGMDNGGGDGLMPPDAMAQMLDAMPLRALANFGGADTAAALPAMLDALRGALAE